MKCQRQLVLVGIIQFYHQNSVHEHAAGADIDNPTGNSDSDGGSKHAAYSQGIGQGPMHVPNAPDFVHSPSSVHTPEPENANSVRVTGSIHVANSQTHIQGPDSANNSYQPGVQGDIVLLPISVDNPTWDNLMEKSAALKDAKVAAKKKRKITTSQP